MADDINSPWLINSIRAVVEYNWESELKDAMECRDEDGFLNGEHIFNDLAALRNIIDGTAFTVEHYLDAASK